MNEETGAGTPAADTGEAQRNLPHLLTELGRQVADGGAKAVGGYLAVKALERLGGKEPGDGAGGGPEHGGPKDGGGEPGAAA